MEREYKMEQKESETGVKYYQRYSFNPVLINLDTQSTWHSHFAKRLNLYQKHLGIPLSLLHNHSVIEFGCNSGENALVLASVGANLTLVEPNDQVLPRLKSLFKKFSLEERIVSLEQESIKSFESDKLYDVVIAEGFLDSLKNRDEMILKISRLLMPGGLGVISFDDRFGCLLETMRRLIFWRAIRLLRIDDIYGELSLETAKKIFWNDFKKLSVSRSFDAWWMDMLINPLITSATRWSYQEIFPLLEKAGCEFYSSSPQWSLVDHFSWYKEFPDLKNRYQEILNSWYKNFLYFLTGFRPSFSETEMATTEIANLVSDLVGDILEYTKIETDVSLTSIVYPQKIYEYFKELDDPKFLKFNREMKELFEAVKSSSVDNLISTYHKTEFVRNLWGCPYHYLCFSKPIGQ